MKIRHKLLDFLPRAEQFRKSTSRLAGIVIKHHKRAAFPFHWMPALLLIPSPLSNTIPSNVFG